MANEAKVEIPEEKVVEQFPEDKKRGKQKFCREGSPLDAIHKLALA